MIKPTLKEVILKLISDEINVESAKVRMIISRKETAAERKEEQKIDKVRHSERVAVLSSLKLKVQAIPEEKTEEEKNVVYKKVGAKSAYE